MQKSRRIEYEPYSRAHLANFKPSQYDRHNLSALRMAQGWEGKATTFTMDGEPVAFAGFSQMGRDMHLWLIMSDEVRNYPIAATKLAAQVLYSVQNHDIDRIVVEVDREFEAARRWALAFGFEPDGEKKMIWQQ